MSIFDNETYYKSVDINGNVTAICGSQTKHMLSDPIEITKEEYYDIFYTLNPWLKK